MSCYICLEDGDTVPVPVGCMCTNKFVHNACLIGLGCHVSNPRPFNFFFNEITMCPVCRHSIGKLNYVRIGCKFRLTGLVVADTALSKQVIARVYNNISMAPEERDAIHFALCGGNLALTTKENIAICGRHISAVSGLIDTQFERHPLIAILAIRRLTLAAMCLESDDYNHLDNMYTRIQEDARLSTTIMNTRSLCQPHGWARDVHCMFLETVVDTLVQHRVMSHHELSGLVNRYISESCGDHNQDLVNYWLAQYPDISVRTN